MSTALFGKGNATILIQDFRCTGREQSLQQCTPTNYSISSYYSRGYYVPNRYVHLTISIPSKLTQSYSICIKKMYSLY